MSRCKYCDINGEELTSRKMKVGRCSDIAELYVSMDPEAMNESGFEITAAIMAFGDLVEEASFKINYCPMCGRKLIGEK